MRAPTLRPPPPSLRRRPFRGAMPTCSPPTARPSTHLSTHPWLWQQITNQRIQPLTSQKDSETARGKGRFRYFHEPQDGLDQCRDSPLFLSFFLSLAPLCLWLNCMDIRTSPKPSMQQEQQPSPQYQSIITSNSLSLFSLSLTFTHRLYQSGTGPG